MPPWLRAWRIWRQTKVFGVLTPFTLVRIVSYQPLQVSTKQMGSQKRTPPDPRDQRFCIASFTAASCLQFPACIRCLAGSFPCLVLQCISSKWCLRRIASMVRSSKSTTSWISSPTAPFLQVCGMKMKTCVVDRPAIWKVPASSACRLFQCLCVWGTCAGETRVISIGYGRILVSSDFTVVFVVKWFFLRQVNANCLRAELRNKIFMRCWKPWQPAVFAKFNPLQLPFKPPPRIPCDCLEMACFYFSSLFLKL